MVLCRRFHRVHTLTTRRDITRAQLRLLVHTSLCNTTRSSILSSRKLLVSAALEILRYMKRRRSNVAIPIKRCCICRVRSYLIVRVRDNSCCLNCMSTLLWRSKVSSTVLVFEESSTVWLLATCVERLHVLLGWWRHGLHGIGIRCPSIIDLVGIHHSSVSALPKSLL